MPPVQLEGASQPVTAEPPQTTQQPVATPAKPIVGIIYPPPEIRNIVDKTASFVARNGPEFETRIRNNEANNPKFNFLSLGDPYHAYYQHKVKEFQEGKPAEAAPAPQKSAPIAPIKVQEAIKAAEQFVPKDPPPEYEFMADPPSINAMDLKVMQQTAQFVARNGRQFLSQLMMREQRNPQFDFLKPQHSMFHYFTKLVEQYTKILIPTKDILTKLRKDSTDMKGLMESLKYRVDWERHQRKMREQAEAEAEKERVAYAQIDWHDFVVVQTVDFQPHEQLNLPPPCTPKDVGARILAQQRAEQYKASAGGRGQEEMDVESDEEETEGGISAAPQRAEPPKIGASASAAGGNVAQQRVSQPVPAPPRPENVVVRKDYDPRLGRQVEKVKAGEKFVISPLTGERIPADKLDQHLRFNTIDQQYFAQKEREIVERQEEELVFAPGLDITSNIRAFAERRTDIFGTGAEETLIGRKIGEQEAIEEQPRTWGADVEGATPSQVSLEQQIADIHKAAGITSEASARPPDAPAPMPPPPPTATMNVITTVPRLPVQMPRQTMVAVPTVIQQPMVLGMGVLTAGAPNPYMAHSMGVLAPGPTMLYQVPTAQVVTAAPPPPSQMGGMVASAPVEASGMVDDEDEGPAAKRTREDFLIPEEDFLRTNKGPIEVKVQVPAMADKPEWKMHGQVLSFTLALTDQISAIKTKIADETSLPTSKQKLVFDNMFVKDNNTLAFYNMMAGAVVQLQLKERGGRKR